MEGLLGICTVAIEGLLGFALALDWLANANILPSSLWKSPARRRRTSRRSSL